ncbi:MAG: hypothetical protein WCO51_11255 [bacterium]
MSWVGYCLRVLGLRQTFGGSPSRWFVSTRGVSTGLALALALSYTKILGVEKRSVLAFIMVSALILTYIFTSGISLALRNKAPDEIRDEEYFGFLTLIGLAGIIVAILNCCLLFFYSYLKTDIPGPIYVVCFVYSFFACVNMGYQDALLAMNNLKLATIFDFTTVAVQIATMTFFITLSQTSLIISVFIGFIFSYALISFATGAVFLNSFSVNFSLLSSGVRSILKQSRQQHLFGIANGLVDRIDRFIIGLILPIGILAKYALLSSIISFARFFPDTAAKLNLLRHHQGKAKKGISSDPGTVLAIIAAGVLFALCAQLFIKFVFGDIWLLPLSVGFLFVAQEVLRGNYQIKAIELIARGGKSEISKISLLLILLSISFITLGSLVFGVFGVPLAMVCVYFILTLQITKVLKRVKNVG